MPGITAGVAAPAYAGIPVTHRELASGVAFVTGHEDPGKPESQLDWAALARFPGTLVFYMGVRALPRIAERLQAEGRPADEPVAVVERGTLPGQRTVLGDARRRGREGGGHPGAGGHAGRPCRRAARGPRVARAAPAARPDRGRHPRACAGEPARRAAARARRRRDRGARDPHRVAARRGAGSRAATTCWSRRARTGCASCSAASATRAQPRRADRGGHGPRDRAGVPRARHRGRHRAAAIRGRGDGRGAGRGRRRARADRPRPGGPRRAARRAARARSRGRRARALRDGARAARRGRGERGRHAPTT